jgi:hypothetical protein
MGIVVAPGRAAADPAHPLSASWLHVTRGCAEWSKRRCLKIPVPLSLLQGERVSILEAEHLEREKENWSYAC